MLSALKIACINYKMLMTSDQAALLVIDVQEKLLPAIPAHQSLLPRLAWLINVCRDCGLPITFTEQYPRGLGPTLESLLELAPNATIVEKTSFSSVADEQLPPTLMQKTQFVVCGLETHVCVLQTVLDLLDAHKQVFVVVDALGSRHAVDHQLGIERMRSAGASMVSREMVLFELVRQAGTEHFKQLSRRYLQGKQP